MIIVLYRCECCPFLRSGLILIGSTSGIPALVIMFVNLESPFAISGNVSRAQEVFMGQSHDFGS